jgi:hypothetical protein
MHDDGAIGFGGLRGVSRKILVPVLGTLFLKHIMKSARTPMEDPTTREQKVIIHN